MTIFKSGEPIFFSGISPFSMAIKAKTNSEFSHVGIVIIENGVPIICESTTEINTPDYITGKLTKGVQKHLLEDRINEYNGKVYHAPLMVKNNNEKAMIEWLDTIHSQEIEYDFKQAFFSGMNFLESKENFNKLFCSELFYKAHKVNEIISERHNASNRNPRHISEIEFVDYIKRVN